MRRRGGRKNRLVESAATSTVEMHAALQRKPDLDLGLARSGSDFVFTVPYGNLNPNCALARNAHGDLYFTGANPTQGFFVQDADGNYRFRIT